MTQTKSDLLGFWDSIAQNETWVAQRVEGEIDNR